jgi:hypothetical protein
MVESRDAPPSKRTTMPSTAGFQFTERDAEIVNYVYQLRVATLDHLAALTNRSYKTLERRVPKLRDERYLRCLKPRPRKGLYVIGSESVPVLIKGGYAPDELAVRRRRENEWKDLMIPHSLLIASIHAKLLLLSRHSPINLTLWQHEDSLLQDTVQTPSDGKLPVRPDAYFILQHTGRPAGRNKEHFFLEADTGTMSHTRIALKIKAYAAYHQQQRHVAKFGMNYFQVAIITNTRARAQNLKKDLHSGMSVAQQRAYHFASLEDLTIETLAAGRESLTPH